MDASTTLPQLALQALDSSLNAVAISDLAGHITYINPAFLALWGYERAEQVLGHHATEFWQSTEAASAVMQALNSSGRWDGMLEGRRVDGQAMALKLSAHLVRGEEGQPQALMASFVDQTALRDAEQALRRERDMAQRLLEAAPVIVLLLDPQGKVLHVNTFFEQLTGYRLADVRGCDWFTRFLPVREQARIREVFETSRRGLTARGNVNAILVRDGSERLIEWYDQILSDDSGTVTGLLAIGSDITERSRVQQELIESGQRLRLQSDHAPEAIVVLDPDLRTFIDVNPAAVELFGMPREQLMRCSPIDLSPPTQPDGRPSSEAAMAKIEAAMTGGSLVFEWVHSRANGPDFPCEVRLVALPAAGRQLVRGSITDITERKRIEQALLNVNAELERRVLERTTELVRTRDEAERANAAKSAFLSRMSHELRTPMNAILGFAQVLETRPLQPREREYVEQIHRAGDHLLNLINDLLDLSGIEAGRLAVTIEAVPLSHVVEEALQLVRGKAAALGIRIACPGAAGEVVLADATRLRQVLVNLLSNAIKYNRSDGAVTLGFSRPDGSRLRISVSDTGPGIAADKLKRLFTPFDRLGAERSNIDGTGLGLALSHQLTMLMGGTLGATSEEGRGSVFFIELPVATASMHP